MSSRNPHNGVPSYSDVIDQIREAKRVCRYPKSADALDFRVGLHYRAMKLIPSRRDEHDAQHRWQSQRSRSSRSGVDGGSVQTFCTARIRSNHHQGDRGGSRLCGRIDSSLFRWKSWVATGPDSLTDLARTSRYDPDTASGC